MRAEADVDERYPDILTDDGFRPLFDGSSLAGWQAIPRVYGDVYPGGPSLAAALAAEGFAPPPHPERHPARWSVENGVLVGQQGTPGYGGYLVTDQAFGDFDLALEIKPDWPADTGVVLRQHHSGWAGFQVLVDHRPSGGIGGFFGNGLASFAALAFAVDAKRDAGGRAVGLVLDDPRTSVEPVTAAKRRLLRRAATGEEFLRRWRWADWNELRVRCVGGALPVLSTWINGLLVAELETATIDVPGYRPADVAAHLGVAGRIALEVHDNDAKFGEARWGAHAQCRWRGIRIREHDLGENHR